jgi:acetyl esterase/lipase
MKAFKVFMISVAACSLLASCGQPSKEVASPGNAEAPAPGSSFLSAGQPVTDLQPGGTQEPVNTSWIKVKYLDLTYAPLSPSQKLDLYLPNKGSGPFPLIIEFHPGGFLAGDKSTAIAPMLKGLKRGYAVVSVAYRLSGEAVFPAAINDAKAAVKYLRANAEKYNLDPRRFAAWGSSAGGNLATLVAVSAGEQSLVDPALGNQDVPDDVQAAVDWFGPLDFIAMDEQFKALGTSGIMGPTSSPDSPESRYLGRSVGTTEALPLARKADPNSYISADDPPMYIQHGTADRHVPITQSREFAGRLTSAIGTDKVVFDSLKGSGHGGAPFEAPSNVAKILKFLDRHLK